MTEAAVKLFSWLSCETECPSTSTNDVHCVILCGSAVLDTVRLAVSAAVRTSSSSLSSPTVRTVPLIITGGIGHSTSFLLDALQRTFPQDISLCSSMEGKSEAELLARVALPQVVQEQRIEGLEIQIHVLPDGLALLGTQLRNDQHASSSSCSSHSAVLHVFLETESTNCGDNAAKTVAYLHQALSSHCPVASSNNNLDDILDQSSPPQSLRVVLLQDPTMMRRSLLSFHHEWDKQVQHWQLPQPPHGPVVVDHNGKSIFQLVEPHWTPLTVLAASFETLRALCVVLDEQNVVMKEDDTAAIRLLDLLLGEVPRLRNDRDGYGPNGKQFIAACDVPRDIEEAARTLCAIAPLISHTSQRSRIV